MNSKNMFKTECACGCGQEVFAYAKDRLGTLPKVYVDKTHEGNDKYKRRFDKGI